VRIAAISPVSSSCAGAAELDVRYSFAHHHDLFFNPQSGVLGMVTGMAASTRKRVMELGMDPRFDLSHAYWLVAASPASTRRTLPSVPPPG